MPGTTLALKTNAAGDILRLTVRENDPVSGRVLDEADQPVAGVFIHMIEDGTDHPVTNCRVQLLGPARKPVGQARTDKTGEFLIRTAVDETGPLTLVSRCKTPEGVEKSITLHGIEAGEEGLVITLR